VIGNYTSSVVVRITKARISCCWGEGAVNDLGPAHRFLTAGGVAAQQCLPKIDETTTKILVSSAVFIQALEQVEKFKCLGVVFVGDEKIEQPTARWIGVASGVLCELTRTTVTKAELILKTKLSVFESISILMLTHGYESWTMTKKLRSRIEAAEMGF
ncbi:unnamed protein product, partial [Soboliphyme baturini]|uniref:FGGY_C domain-containing protein n=1 Tax=Soboliphyme baturini TaxID=241478 RepID=A0A183JAN3_9BILA